MPEPRPVALFPVLRQFTAAAAAVFVVVMATNVVLYGSPATIARLEAPAAPQVYRASGSPESTANQQGGVANGLTAAPVGGSSEAAAPEPRSPAIPSVAADSSSGPAALSSAAETPQPAATGTPGSVGAAAPTATPAANQAARAIAPPTGTETASVATPSGDIAPANAAVASVAASPVAAPAAEATPGSGQAGTGPTLAASGPSESAAKSTVGAASGGAKQSEGIAPTQPPSAFADRGQGTNGPAEAGPAPVAAPGGLGPSAGSTTGQDETPRRVLGVAEPALAATVFVLAMATLVAWISQRRRSRLGSGGN